MQWYEEDVKQVERISLAINYRADTIFYGSSSVRMWTTLERDLPELKPVNLGFGGSTMAACVWFFDRIMVNYEPKRLVVYAGDNDLGDGRHPEEVFLFFEELVLKVQHRFGDIPCYFISAKPSLARWGIVDKFRYANQLIEKEIQDLHNWHFINVFDKMLNAEGTPNAQLFGPDGLHLSPAGYMLWAQIVNEEINATVNTEFTLK